MNIADLFNNVLYATIFGSVVGLIIFALKSTVLKKIPAKWQYLMWSVMIIKLIFPRGPESNISIFNKINLETTFTKSELLIAKPQPLTVSEYTVQNVFDIVSFIWLSGFMISIVWVITSFLILNYRLRKSVQPSKNTLMILDNCKRVAGVNRRVNLIVQNHIKTTALFGIIRPKILITEDFEKAETTHIEYTFMHELSHLKRGDIAVNYLLLFLRCVHWFNPVIWFLFSKIRRDTELATDERTLLYINPTEYKSYGMTLINTLTESSVNAPSLLGIAKSRRDIKWRIKAISKFKKPNFIQHISGILTIIFISSVCLTSAVVAKPISNMIYENIPKSALPKTEEKAKIQVSSDEKVYAEFEIEETETLYHKNEDTEEATNTTEQSDVFSGTDTIDLNTYANLISYNSDLRERHYFVIKPNADGSMLITTEVFGSFDYLISVDISNTETPGYGWEYNVPSTTQSPFYMDGLDPDEEYIVIVDTYCPGYYGIEGEILIY